MAQVVSSGGFMRLEGVPPLRWDQHSCTFLGALEAALSVTDRPVAYVDLMGWSAMAFRTRWFRGVSRGELWCPSSPVGESPEEWDAVVRATGWRLRGVARMDRGPNPQMEDFADDVRRSIGAGLPVLAYDASLNMGVISGCSESGGDVVFHGFSAPPRTMPLSEAGPMLGVLEGQDPQMDERDAFVMGLSMAVRNWTRGPSGHSPKGAYLYGEQALLGWRDDISGYDEWSPEQRESLYFVSWWCYSSLADARRNAAPFLRKHGASLGSDGLAAIEEAARLFDKEAHLLCGPFARGDAFAGPWTGKTVAEWSPEMRLRERELLDEVRGLEASASALVAGALKASGVSQADLTPATEGPAPR